METETFGVATTSSIKGDTERSHEHTHRWVVGIDIGIKNFAFAVLQVPLRTVDHQNAITLENLYKHFELVHYENIDLEGPSGRKCTEIRANNMNAIFLRLYEVLKSFETIWGECSDIVIEQQMQYRHATNIKALKLSQHVLAYFLMHHHMHANVVEYPAYHKTSVWKAPAKLKKHERKRWSVEKVRWLMEQKGHTDVLDDLKKKDDVCDCVLMGLAYAFTNVDASSSNPHCRLLT